MRAVNHALPFESDFSLIGTAGEALYPSESGRNCLLHHLVVAAEELAGDERLADGSIRYVLLAARLRDM
ncbi:MAG TPA: hypothetical protein VGH33_20225, partial [Isosphaeraceae bacterium]